MVFDLKRVSNKKQKVKKGGKKNVLKHVFSLEGVEFV